MLIDYGPRGDERAAPAAANVRGDESKHTGQNTGNADQHEAGISAAPLSPPTPAIAASASTPSTSA